MIVSATDTVCFHCGLDLPAAAIDGRWAVSLEQQSHAMCCPGCQSVAQAIIDSGNAGYYTNRTALPARAEGAELVPPELEMIDRMEAQGEFTAGAAAQDGDSEALLALDGIRCAACVWLIERHVGRMPGVVSAQLNVSTERLALRWNKEQCSLRRILQALRAIGYPAYPFDAARQQAQRRRDRNTLFRQLFVAGLSMMQVMMYAIPVYMAGAGDIEADMHALMRWASLFLTLPAVAYSALPFFKGAWRDLKAGSAGMDVPVALGIAVGFVASVIATVRDVGDVYFDTVTMFIFLLLCSRYLELAARRKSAATLERMHQAFPASAQRLTAYPHSRATEVLASSQLQVGDMILVRPGEAVAADAVVAEGESSLDLSLLSGESRPATCGVGSQVPGGAVNLSQPLVLQVQRESNASTLAVLALLAQQAGAGKPEIARRADRFAASFVKVLLLLVFATFCFWQWYDPSRAWLIAVAVLVVSCPCALSLATPSALAATTDRLLREGILIAGSHVLETLHRASVIVFDKTGTLTRGRPVLLHCATVAAAGNGMDAGSCIRIAAAMEASSTHPLGQALTAAAQASSDAATSVLRVTAECATPGAGLAAQVDGVSYRLGTADFVQGLCRQPLPQALNSGSSGAATQVYLGSEHGWQARFDIADALRPDAAATVQWFQRHGKQVILLSGDRQAVVDVVARRLGIDQAIGDRLPQGKLEFVQHLQQAGEVVAMIGDGVNDAAVLRAADVSFSMGAGAALAQAHADVVLLKDQLSSFAETAAAAGRTMRVMRQNLAWATLYNVVAIPAAAMGLIDPWLCAVGMSASSAIVVCNALRLRRPGRPQLLLTTAVADQPKEPHGSAVSAHSA